LIGASNSNKTGWFKKISLDVLHNHFISASDNGIILFGL
jgi:hypothetical protein